MKRRTNRRRRSKPSEAADALHRFGRRLEQLARSVQARVSEPGHRRQTSFLAKPTGEGPSRHMRLLGKCVEVERQRKMFQHPVAKGSELVAGGVWSQPLDVLSLASL